MRVEGVGFLNPWILSFWAMAQQDIPTNKKTKGGASVRYFFGGRELWLHDHCW